VAVPTSVVVFSKKCNYNFTAYLIHGYGLFISVNKITKQKIGNTAKIYKTNTNVEL